MLTTSAAVPVNVLSLHLRYAVTHRAPENSASSPGVRDRDLSSVPLIARTRAVLYGENLGRSPTIDFVSLS